MAPQHRRQFFELEKGLVTGGEREVTLRQWLETVEGSQHKPELGTM